MPILTVHLREGFYQTLVVVCIAGRERFRAEVTTRMQIGLAKTIPFDVYAGNIEVEIRFPSLNHSIRETIDVHSEMHLGVNLDQNGHASLYVQREPFRYM